MNPTLLALVREGAVQRVALRRQVLAALLGNGASWRSAASCCSRVLLHRRCDAPGWRVTRFDLDGEPLGHVNVDAAPGWTTTSIVQIMVAARAKLDTFEAVP